MLVFSFLVSSIIAYVLLLSLVLGVHHPASFASLYVCTLLYVLPFAFFSLVQRASNLQPFQIKLLA